MGIVLGFCYLLISPVVLVVMGIAHIFSDLLAQKDK